VSVMRLAGAISHNAYLHPTHKPGTAECCLLAEGRHFMSSWHHDDHVADNFLEKVLVEQTLTLITGLAGISTSIFWFGCRMRKDAQCNGAMIAELVMYLRGEASAGVHDEGPELMAAGHRGDVQAIIIALLNMLVYTCIGHVVVVALLHRPVRIVDGNPLRCRQAQPDLLFGRLAHDTRSQPEGLRAHYRA